MSSRYKPSLKLLFSSNSVISFSVPLPTLENLVEISFGCKCIMSEKFLKLLFKKKFSNLLLISKSLMFVFKRTNCSSFKTSL